MQKSFLPITKDEIAKLGWDCADVIIVTGDAYVDHPAFGAAIIGRFIEYLGYRVAILPQPNWRDDLRDFKKLGKPRLFFGVTAGNMDSMVNHYTALKRLRSNDSYTPGDRAGYRPDYASVVYSKILKSLYPDVPVILGGVEASMRRFTHYDYWSDSLKPSVLVESDADLLIYGMAEKTISMILPLLDKGVPINSLKNLPQIVYKIPSKEPLTKTKDVKDVFLPSHEECSKSKKLFSDAFRLFEESGNSLKPSRIIQKSGNEVVVSNPMIPYLEEDDMDTYYGLPYTRLPHPKYKNKPPIPAFEMIKHSVTIHRGCFGACSFCTISAHQGRFVSSRSEDSVLKEVAAITESPGFKGYISDLGGPSANMYKMKGFDIEICYRCKRASCIYPEICVNLNYDHKPALSLYQKAADIKGVKKVNIGSGIRYDMLVNRSREEVRRFGLDDYTKDIVTKRVSGRLKVAPEHTCDNVLSIMRKPSFKLYKMFYKEFRKICIEAGLKQELIPYFISGHPGSTKRDMAKLADELRTMALKPEQVQEFTPTPMTLASTIYYSGIDPYSKNKVFSEKEKTKKREQKNYFFSSNKRARNSSENIKKGNSSSLYETSTRRNK
ncbi:MAG: YgiQ family radical SAM protein [Bacteroidales bacterium]